MKRTALVLLLSLCSAAMVSSDSPKRPRILGICRVTILSTDLPQSLSFYAMTLDTKLEPCDWCERMPTRVFFLNPNQILDLTTAPVPAPENMILTIAFQTDDVPKLRRYLEEQKIQVNNIDHSKPAAGSVLSMNDPEGHRIIFMDKPLTPPIPLGSISSPPVSKLHIIHAGFVVRDRAATDHFYKDILGFRPYWHGGMKDDETNWVDMQVPDGTDWIEYMLNVPANADEHTLGVMNHIALGVPDIQAAKAQLIKNGWKPGEEPKIGRDGKWQLNLYDPDDTRVELMEFTPVQKPCCSEFTGPHPGQHPQP